MKQFVQNFNNLIKKTIFKVQNKTNNKFIISNFNKYLIAFISLLFFYLFYLLLPILYDKSWVQSSIENQLLKEFKINFSTSSNISYRILPAPHFLIKDSKIFKKVGEKTTPLSEIKNLKVFIHQTNFFDKIMTFPGVSEPESNHYFPPLAKNRIAFDHVFFYLFSKVAF